MRSETSKQSNVSSTIQSRSAASADDVTKWSEGENQMEFSDASSIVVTEDDQLLFDRIVGQFIEMSGRRASMTEKVTVHIIESEISLPSERKTQVVGHVTA